MSSAQQQPWVSENPDYEHRLWSRDPSPRCELARGAATLYGSRPGSHFLPCRVEASAIAYLHCTLYRYTVLTYVGHASINLRGWGRVFPASSYGAHRYVGTLALCAWEYCALYTPRLSHARSQSEMAPADTGARSSPFLELHLLVRPVTAAASMTDRTASNARVFVMVPL